ncbi:hypothetical protein NQ317_006377 [Molorchus minor]|uniref:Uncharacterized protein n=1 Tax=Molorchus minor TaxID=1323400 RepID=A0ABQ9JNM9_9CUCU|nr:hypothetical protein NQ317_006377 [Molorchus minor]
MRQSAGPHHRLDQQPIVSSSLPATSDSIDTLTTTTGSQHTVSAEVVEVEEHDVVGSDGESVARETLKLTARGRPGAHTPRADDPPPPLPRVMRRRKRYRTTMKPLSESCLLDKI